MRIRPLKYGYTMCPTCSWLIKVKYWETENVDEVQEQLECYHCSYKWTVRYYTQRLRISAGEKFIANQDRYLKEKDMNKEHEYDIPALVIKEDHPLRGKIIMVREKINNCVYYIQSLDEHRNNIEWRSTEVIGYPTKERVEQEREYVEAIKVVRTKLPDKINETFKGLDYPTNEAGRKEYVAMKKVLLAIVDYIDDQLKIMLRLKEGNLI
jgi:hypothetical protein